MNSNRPLRKRWNPFFNIILLVSLIAVFLPAQAGAQSGRYDGWHPMMRGWGMGGFGMIFNIALWILAAAVLIWIIRWIFQLGGRSETDSSSGSRPLDILNERYARGEIDKSQYDAMKQDIISH